MTPAGNSFPLINLNIMENLNDFTDEQLALAYSRGDNRAFDVLLARNEERLFAYIMFIVQDESKANDFFQETFVKVITKLQEGSYTNSGVFAAWLIRIAHNVIIDYYRDKKIRNVVDSDTCDDLSTLGGGNVLDSNIESRYVNEQVLTDVRRIMEKLPTTQKEVVYMHYYRGMTFKEIADITGVSINTALGRMRYAISNMRRMSRRYGIALQLD